MQCRISPCIIDRKLFSSCLLSMTIKYIKYIKKFSMTLKYHEKNFSQFAKIRKHIKSCFLFSIHEISEKTLRSLNMTINISNCFANTINSLDLTIIQLSEIKTFVFKNLRRINLSIDAKEMSNVRLYGKILKKTINSTRLEHIEVDPIFWPGMHILKRMPRPKTLTLTSNYENMFETNCIGLIQKISEKDLNLNIELENSDQPVNPERLKMFFENCQALSIHEKSNFNTLNQLFHSGLENLKKIQNFKLFLDSPISESFCDSISNLSTLNSLKKLEMELNFSEVSNSKKFFNSFSFPIHLYHLKINLNKCKKDTFSKLTHKEEFFLSLGTLHELRKLDFQINKRLFSALSEDSTHKLIQNLLSNVNKDLTYLKLATSSRGQADEIVLKEIINLSKLNSISVDMGVANFSLESLNMIKTHDIRLKYLSLYDNLLLLHLPPQTLANLEELCISISPESFGSRQNKGDFSEYENGSSILKKILAMKNLRAINLYLFRKSLFKHKQEFLIGMSEILKDLKKLESIFVLVWSIEIEREEAFALENSFRYNKVLNFVYIMIGITTIGRDVKRRSYTSFV